MNPITIIKQRIKKFSITFNESTLVLLRKLDRVSSVSTTTTTTSAAASTTTTTIALFIDAKTTMHDLSTFYKSILKTKAFTFGRG